MERNLPDARVCKRGGRRGDGEVTRELLVAC